MIKKQNGFTLLEALVVLAIAAVLAAFALPSLDRWRQQGAFKEVSRTVSGALRKTHSAAIAEHWEHRVEFDVSGNSYRISRGNLANGSTTWPQVVMPWTPVSPGITLGSGADCTSTSDVNIVFMPDGTCDAVGFICIMEGSTKKFRVAVTSTATGHTEISRWDGGWKR